MPPKPQKKPAVATMDVVGSIRNQMLDKAKDKLAKDLGLTAGDIKGDLLAKLEESLDRQLKSRIEVSHVNSAISTALRQPKMIGPALQNLVQVTKDTLHLNEFDQALDNNAQVLFKTYKSFVKAGFTDDQAFQIILSQLQR